MISVATGAAVMRAPAFSSIMRSAHGDFIKRIVAVAAAKAASLWIRHL